MTEVIKWDSNRFIIKQFMDTGAVYIYDRIDNVGYINTTEVSRLCQANISNISKLRNKTPKDLKALLGKDIETCAIENTQQGRDFQCFSHDEFYATLHYYVVFSSGKETRIEAAKLLFQIGKAGSLVFIMHVAGVKVKPVFDDEINIETIDVHDRVMARLEGLPVRKNYCSVMAYEYESNFKQWEIKERLTMKDFMGKWSNFTYSLLLGTNADGLRQIKFCDGKLIIGRNHLVGAVLLQAIMTVERYVATRYNSENYNNLKRLHIEGSQIAVLQYQLIESESYILNTGIVRELPVYKNPNLLEGE